jgi:hypothetical protein
MALAMKVCARKLLSRESKRMRLLACRMGACRPEVRPEDRGRLLRLKGRCLPILFHRPRLEALARTLERISRAFPRRRVSTPSLPSWLNRFHREPSVNCSKPRASWGIQCSPCQSLVTSAARVSPSQPAAPDAS